MRGEDEAGYAYELSWSPTRIYASRSAHEATDVVMNGD